MIWFHLADINYCLTLKPNTFSIGVSVMERFDLPRPGNRKLFICVDGFTADPFQKDFYNKLIRQLCDEDRIVICSSLATLGKSNIADDIVQRRETFHVPSWTKEEYLSAMANETFYQAVKGNLNAHKVRLSKILDFHEVDGEGNGDRNVVTEEREQAFIWKFYYAGGACRYMFQFPMVLLMEQLERALKSVKKKHEQVSNSSGKYNADEMNRLYGMTSSGERFAVSSYVTHVFARYSDPEKISELLWELNAQDNPSIDGFIFEWLFFASVQNFSLELFDVNDNKLTLPMADVVMFDPKRNFKILQKQDKTFTVAKSNFWLQPVAVNQGGYDAVYINSKNKVVIFVQLAISHQHSLKLHFFHAVLQNLHATTDKMKTRSQKKLMNWKVEIYCIVKKSQLSEFKISDIDGKMLLSQFDPKWAGQEEEIVKVFAISDIN